MLCNSRTQSHKHKQKVIRIRSCTPPFTHPSGPALTDASMKTFRLSLLTGTGSLTHDLPKFANACDDS